MTDSVTPTRRIAQVGGPLLPAADVDTAVGAFLRTSPPTLRWDVDFSFDWAQADAGRLTEGERSAVQFITIIEDHLPGYFALYEQNFPVDDSVDRETYIHNRELYHFTVRWAQEEDTHARALARYQLSAGLAERDALWDSLAEEGRKQFQLPHDEAVQFFTYPLVQEKATQIYYQHLRQAVGDPLLKEILVRLSKDEARHFSFFADMVRLYLERYGDAVVDPIREVIAEFRMPLADTIRGYWRWALKIADTARYDHTEAYDHLVKVVNRAVDARSDKVDELISFVTACRQLQTSPL
ncbi:acyl-ACP desaturase [Streptomyces sp. WMMC1477]|uniref:acyl-ACP desaturase n=1 Tax=Streptomyces sp. WMMC1477 TaxID=3015155 RepID=UPI0022B72D3B|nr:acyl-ACP desaturase [Streptomyces sp. WMMC1477]MCZ7432067.1 acyl-ACP desaturase [Streptomyces sp. WMMC1477]